MPAPAANLRFFGMALAIATRIGVTEIIKNNTPAQKTIPSAVCQGTLLSREQYLHDVAHGGYVDGRLPPSGTMSAADIALWTDAIAEDAAKTKRSVG